MNWLEAVILGILQGLTEFLPVSSSGHLEIGKVLLGIDAEKSLVFTIVVHGATVLSTIVVFRKDLQALAVGSFSVKWNQAQAYNLKMILSMVPVIFLGLFFRDEIEALFTGNLLLVGITLIITAALLGLTRIVRAGKRDIGYADALIIGLAQAVAVLPGLSRSGATISTGLLLGNDRDQVTRFSFLMVLVPIIGANLLDILNYEPAAESSVEVMPMVAGFLAAFFTGWLACSWMIRIVRKGNLAWFAVYCIFIGLVAIIFS